MDTAMVGVTWDDGQLLRPRSGDEEVHAKGALRAALRKHGWKGSDADLSRWIPRLRVGGDCVLATFVHKLPNGEPGLAAGPVSDVAPRLLYESDVDRDVRERLEGRVEL